MHEISITKKLKEGYRLIEREDFEDWLEQEYKRKMRSLIQKTVDADFERQIGTSRYERTEERKSYRNGYYYRDLYTKFCLVRDIKMPRARSLRVDYHAFKKWQKMHHDFKHLVLELILTGSSYYEIEDYLAQEMPISRSTISSIVQQLRGEVADFHCRAIPDDIAILYLDGIWVKARSSKVVVLTVMGIDLQGQKKILDFQACYRGESEENWFKLLNRVYDRGLKGGQLKLIVRDGCQGLKQAARFIYPQVKQQSCLLHIKRNIMERAHCKGKTQFGESVRWLFDAKDRNDYNIRFEQLKIQYSETQPKAIRHMKMIEEDAFTYLEFSIKVRTIITTNNYIERFFGFSRAFLKRRSSFNDLRSIDSFMFLIAYKYNLKEIDTKNWRGL